ncbi:unnamed protein product [Closterium sp. NIES-64]|nr:unnamed protein product [Closterium sp. NIES-64]
MVAVRALVLACMLLLVSTSALAQRGPPGGGPPGGQHGSSGAGSGGPGDPGGRDGPGGPGGPRGPPLSLTAVGNLTADVDAQLANCTVDQKTLNGSFHLAAMLVDAAGGPPDSVAIVKGAVCDAAATDVLALPLAATDWQQRAGWWLLHAEARLDAFLENADAATLDALLAVLPTALPPPTSGGGRNRGGSTARGARNGQGGRRMGRELLMRASGRAAKPKGQKHGGQQQGGAQQAPAVRGYAVLAGSSAADVTWGGQLMGAKMPAAAV